MNIRLILTLITLAGLIYGILQVKFFLDDNFVKKDTVIKKQLNDFLNGKQKMPGQKPTTQKNNSTGIAVEIKKDEMDQIQEKEKIELDKMIQKTQKE